MEIMEVGMAMDSSSITNYDVLVEPPTIPGGEGGDYQLAKHKNHVGNNRLDVFLNLHQSAYDDAFCKGNFDTCNEIVQKIVGTVCHQCVPPGRFLVCSKDPTSADRVLWTQMTEDKAKNLLHKVLAPQQPTKLKSNKRNDDGMKRRRRSSLLRRSASESMVTAFQDDKKKVTRFDQLGNNSNMNWGTNQRTGGFGGGFSMGAGGGLGSRTSIIGSAAATANRSLNRMDVILTDARNALDPNSQSVGNNRLHILVAMQSGQYQTSSPEGRNGMIAEAYKTVKIFWKGRFLVDTNGTHDELDEDEAKYALQCIFDERTGQKTQAPLQRHSSPGLGSPDPAPAVAAVAPPTQFFTARPFGLHKQSSLSMMPPTSPGSQLPDMEDMRKSAVKSLQKQKKRQTIANRLEKFSERTLTGSSKQPPAGSSMQPPAGSAAMPPPPARNRGFNLFGGGARVPFRMPGTTQSYPSIQQKRESTILGKLDASVMDQLVADFEEADCEDDGPEPLPPSNSNQFGSQWNSNPNGFR